MSNFELLSNECITKEKEHLYLTYSIHYVRILIMTEHNETRPHGVKKWVHFRDIVGGLLSRMSPQTP